MDPAQPQGQIDPNAEMPQYMPSSIQQPAEFLQQRPADMGSSDTGHKKLLLQKLMSNLLSKPGRSMHEMINGVKEAIGAYKNYSKEWDTLTGVGQGVAGASAGSAAPSSSAMGATGIQKILQDIQSKKADGSGGPGDVTRPTMPAQAQVNPVLGNPMGNPNEMTLRPQQTPALGNTSSPEIPPTPQPARPPQMPQNSMQSLPNMIPSSPQTISSQDSFIAGNPQTSTFNRPAPINQFGVFGY